jgi:subtilisin family serine protease
MKWAANAWCVGVVLVATALPVYAADDGECGPFPEDAVQLPIDPPATDEVSPDQSEWLVVLPQLPDGSVGAADFELGPLGRIRESSFSPVLCATIVRVVGPADAAPASLIAALPTGAAAVPNDIYRTAATPPVESASQRSGPDPYRSLQHGLDRAGVDEAPAHEADVAVAVLDSRPDLDHPDLGRLELVETHRVDERAGVHGTLIAGILAATPNNSFGIAGIAPSAKVLAVPVCRAARSAGQPDLCQLYDLVLGADAAWAAGAQIFNFSLVGPSNAVLERTVARLDRLGAVVVAAAGNEGLDEARYPAAYTSVISVGAVDRDGKTWVRSNHGESVEISAPGAEIVTTVPGGGFAFSNGTSLATAHVAGVLALLTSRAESPHDARRVLFEAGHGRPEATRTQAALPTVCEALARLGTACDAESP